GSLGRGSIRSGKVAGLLSPASPGPIALIQLCYAQYTTTLLMLSPLCISSNPLLMSASVIVWVIIGSISILPSMYQSTILGTSVRPRAPPNAVPFQTRPVTSWNGRAAISAPAGATPMIMDSPHPALARLWALPNDADIAGAVERTFGAADLIRTALCDIDEMRD